MKFILTCVTTLFLVNTYCLADVLDTIQELNTTRAGKYNAPLASVIDKRDPMDLSKLVMESSRIDNLLTKNVNTKVHATKEQQKKALQAVFATEIIYGAARPSYLEGINATNPLYGHCYVLEYSALLARDFNVSGSGGAHVNTPAYKKLYSYSGLDGDILRAWYIEVRDQHITGKQLREERVKALATKSTHRRPPTPLPLDVEEKHKSSPDMSAHTGSFKDNWSSTYTLKDGKLTVSRTPTSVQLGEMSNSSGIFLLCRNYKGLSLNGGIFLDKDASQIDFVNALIRSGAYEGTAKEIVDYETSGNWTETFTLLDGTQINHTPTSLIIFPDTPDEECMEDIYANAINNMRFKGLLRLYTKSTRSEFVRSLEKGKAI
jgi:hypothetical protein